MMKKFTLSLLLFFAAFRLGAQTFDQWFSPEENAVNRLPMHTDFFAFRDADEAAGDRTASANFMSLDGLWKFNWVRDADMRPTGFFRTDFDDRSWGTMPVPGMWELNGYGDPLYVNIGYAWQNDFRNNPPEVPVRNNHVGSYRRFVTIPDEWSGRQVIAHFGSVTSNIYLWVNGRFAGYSEDSRLEAEFDITKYLHKGRNLIAFQVFRWSDGTYVEDQDFWRLCGVARQTYLCSRPANNRLEDIRVTPNLDADYRDGRLTVELTVKGRAEAELSLTDASGATVATERLVVSGRAEKELKVASPHKWSAEEPYLYTLTATLRSGGKVQEVVPVKVGFRKVEIRGSQLLLNGQPVLIKGVDRHEMDPDGGYVVSEERMMSDMEVMKRYNINAVRTSHYPNDRRWYDMCDRYGIYVVAEANLESHGMGYGEESLARRPDFAKTHLERNSRNVQRNFNHPSVIVWSLGNEAGDGPNFDACYDWVKREDPSRPVQYERAGLRRNTDIYCPMYPDHAYCERYSASTDSVANRPLILCEYSHMMGNSGGGFRQYWELVRKYPKFQGGFIWDFADQGLRAYRGGKMIYTFGGDYNPYDPSDMNFNCNGLFDPDRRPHPHAEQVKYVYQNIWAEAVDLSRGEIAVRNENFFRSLAGYRLEWELLCDGRAIRSGVTDSPNVAPQTECTIVLPYDVSTAGEGELLLNISFKLKEADGLLPAGYTVARRQLAVREYVPQPLPMRSATDVNRPVAAPAIDTVNSNRLRISGERFTVEFARRSGFMVRYAVSGAEMIAEGSALEPNFWRAPTDNDYGGGAVTKSKVWRKPEFTLQSLDASVEADSVAVVEASYAIPQVGAQLVMKYIVDSAGAITVSQKMHADPSAPDMFRYGVKVAMPAEYDTSTYYGRGPTENYADRNDAAFLGVYCQTADEQAHAYVRPQETGTKTDMRYWRQTDRGGRGIEITASAPFCASALHYSAESLDGGDEKAQRHFGEVERSPLVFLSIDMAHVGAGGVDSWSDDAIAMEPYRLHSGTYDFCFRLTPIR